MGRATQAGVGNLDLAGIGGGERSDRRAQRFGVGAPAVPRPFPAGKPARRCSRSCREVFHCTVRSCCATRAPVPAKDTHHEDTRRTVSQVLESGPPTLAARSGWKLTVTWCSVITTVSCIVLQQDSYGAYDDSPKPWPGAPGQIPAMVATLASYEGMFGPYHVQTLSLRQLAGGYALRCQAPHGREAAARTARGRISADIRGVIILPGLRALEALSGCYARKMTGTRRYRAQRELLDCRPHLLGQEHMDSLAAMQHISIALTAVTRSSAGPRLLLKHFGVLLAWSSPLSAPPLAAT